MRARTFCAVARRIAQPLVQSTLVLDNAHLLDAPRFGKRRSRGVPGASRLLAYVGQQVRGRQASPLGNPFKVESDDERDAAIVKYEEWLREKIAADDREVIGDLESSQGVPSDPHAALLVRRSGVTRK
jgi:hypothetical protein